MSSGGARAKAVGASATRTHLGLAATAVAAIILGAHIGSWHGRTLVPIDIATTNVPWSHAPGLAPQNPLRDDVGMQLWPMRELVAKALRSAEAPLWSHELGTGQPLAGNAQSAPFSPFTLVALPWSPLEAIGISAALAAAVAAFGAMLLAWRLGCGSAGGMLAAVAFGASGWMAAWCGWPNAQVAAWLPLVLVGVLEALERRSLRAVVVLATAVAGAVVAGHPGTVVLLASACLPVALTAGLQVWRRSKAEGEPAAARRRSILRGGAMVAVGLVLALGLAAPALVPLGEALPESTRAWTLARRSPEPRTFEPTVVTLAVSPFLEGSPRGDTGGTWRGPSETGKNFNELVSWAGAIPLVLALAGAIVGVPRARAVLGGGVVALAFAAALPPFGTLAGMIPSLRAAQIGRATVFWTLAVALAAALTLSHWGGSSPSRRLRWWVVALAAGEAVILLCPWTSLVGGERLWTTVAGAGLGAVAIAAALRVRATGFVVLVIVAGGLELATFHQHLVPTYPSRLNDPPILAQVLDEMRQQGGALVGEGGELRANLPAVWGLSDPRGNDPMRPARVSRFLAATGWRHNVSGAFELPHVRAVSPAVLDYLGVRWLITPETRRPPRRWQHFATHDGLVVWRNPWAAGTFGMPTEVVPTERIWAEIPTIGDFTARALVEGTEWARAGLDATAAVQQPPREIVVQRRGNGFTLELAQQDSPPAGPQILVSNVSWAPGWRVHAGSGEARTLRVNGAFLGVLLPTPTAMATHIELDYRPRGWRVSLAVSACSLLVLGSLAMWSWKQIS